ncbi:5-methyltetrahydropteroyltriglutamate--homocysteine S-methyltransferase [Limisphaera sp. VF-2]|uniref:5-methyltetrahydropteroyltriglutamate-- homocysteine S-methyltransferase n=1 Tax=Limisphaera sp. VF-2 TaxID=3400418 RepID=UPI001753021B
MNTSRLAVHNLGFPRIGPRRELKHALESFWAGRSSAEELLETARVLRAEVWHAQHRAGVDWIPSGDFSLYDHVLDTVVLLGCIPPRFGQIDGEPPLSTYFALARGLPGIPPLELTKWFDTNYHHLVPEVREGQRFRLGSEKPFREFSEATALGLRSLPVLLGPVTFLALARAETPRMDKLKLLPALLPVYAEILDRLASLGATWVQLDEPILSTPLTPEWQRALIWAYERLRLWSKSPRILVATYFGGLDDNRTTALELAVDGLHLDLVRAPHDLAALLPVLPRHWVLSLGVIDGRNPWRCRLDRAWALVRRAVNALGPSQVWIAPSCSLLHVPLSARLETRLSPWLRAELAFALEKLEELNLLATAALQTSPPAPPDTGGPGPSSPNPREIPEVRKRVAAATQQEPRRSAPAHIRRQLHQRRLALPPLPTTTIGSFPQDAELRRMRAQWKQGRLGPEQYQQFLQQRITACIRIQEAAGLDVLVHGEFERNDMVEYFAEHLAGFAITDHGWVQSYGSRCVKPPLLFGDVYRPAPITVPWWQHAQAATQRPVKAILTGPITLLQWSFVREDLPRDQVAYQLALAIREEIRDLEASGCSIIQVDEPALREGLPLSAPDQALYLEWAPRAFQLAICQAKDETQIHSHMCYCDFRAIEPALRAMEIDVLSLEAARSRMEILDVCPSWAQYFALGPGVWDVHSPHTPTVAELTERIQLALTRIPPERLWINPDCGLKTRSAQEVEAGLKNLVEAAQRVRLALSQT